MAHHHEHEHCHQEHEHGCSCHHEHERGCACCEEKLSGESTVEKGIFFRIGLSAALFLAGLLFPSPWWFVAAYGVIAWDILWAAAKNIRKGQVFDEQFLMSIASLGAFAIGEYPEAVAVMLFYQIGETFQTIAVGRSRASITALMALKPEQARILRDGKEFVLPPEQVATGDVLLIKPGERIPLDGVVLQGQSTIDYAALTGESVPQPIDRGDNVLSGSVNLTGVLQVRVSSPYAESTVARILHLQQEASEKKARVERFITRFSRWYTPCVVAAAAALALIVPLFAGNFTHWLHRALIFLVVSCPCALVVSVPLSFFGGIGGAARQGILVKGAGALELLSRVDTFAFDKTGTLTRGEFILSGVQGDRSVLLPIAGALEINSNHPVARCLAAYGTRPAENLREYPGGGVAGTIDGKMCFAGNRRFLQEMGVQLPAGEDSDTVVHIAREGMYLGALYLQDEIRPEGAEVLRQLKAAGIRKAVMLTGDREEIAGRVAEKLGMDKVFARLLPADKVSTLEELMKNGHRVAVIGDGINDAPVLARGDVGIAMGGVASDAAIESADVVLMENSLSKLPVALGIAKKTMAIVKQNILFALGAKCAILVLGALGIANMWVAVFGDVGVMILATLNALRSYLWRKSS